MVARKTRLDLAIRDLVEQQSRLGLPISNTWTKWRKGEECDGLGGKRKA